MVAVLNNFTRSRKSGSSLRELPIVNSRRDLDRLEQALPAHGAQAIN